MCATYQIKFAPDSLMPPGRDYVLVRQDDGSITIYYRESVRVGPPEACARMLEDSWAGFRELISREQLASA